MTYQLLNENYVRARNLTQFIEIKKYEHQKCYLFKCLYLIYHLIQAYTKLSHQLAVRPGLTQNRRSMQGLNRLLCLFPPSFKHTEYSARLLRRSNAYLFRKSTCTRSTLTKLSKLQRQSSIFISPSMFILTLQPLERKLPPVPWQRQHI